MRIETIRIQGFRCFDEVGTTIALTDCTCLIGPNASGKTAAMMALARMFGESSSLRQIVPTDFHLAAGEDIRAVKSRKLLIECRLSFPAVAVAGDSASAGIPETFNQMTVDEPGGPLYCRVQLEAMWEDDGTPEGDVRQDIYWVPTGSCDADEIAKHRRAMRAADRGRIRVVYVPASRDPDRQVRGAAATGFHRLVSALDLGTSKGQLQNALESLQNEVSQVAGIQTIEKAVQESWQRIYDGSAARELRLAPSAQEPETLVRQLTPVFHSADGNASMETGGLSDGQRSLFSLAMSAGLFRAEEKLHSEAEKAGFKAEIADALPILTVFAVEEPENHLSPQYLGKAVALLNGLAEDARAQVLQASHSPAIVRRVPPESIGYFLGHERTRATKVKSIMLPPESSEAHKYVREAVRGFPELYFARLVVLGEGPSEEIVLQRLFEASGLPLDSCFIAVVPLGGRHVNHFWRLLHDLEIPFLTLLDLDLEKAGAGWGRIQYVRDQLVERYGQGNPHLTVEKPEGKCSIEDKGYDQLGDRAVSDPRMALWLEIFESCYGVFFSSPLDLDLAMLEAFPNAYTETIGIGQTGPRLPAKEDSGYERALQARVDHVLASDPEKPTPGLGSTYSAAQRALFPWYKFLFADGSKPVSHIRGLSALSDDELLKGAPGVLKRLAARAKEMLGQNQRDA